MSFTPMRRRNACDAKRFEEAQKWLDSLGDSPDLPDDETMVSTQSINTHSDPAESDNISEDAFVPQYLSPEMESEKCTTNNLYHSETPLGSNISPLMDNTSTSYEPPVKIARRSESSTGSTRRSVGSDFQSGCKGVSWNNRMKAWLAFWMDSRTRRSKTFSTRIYGFNEAKELAIEFLREKKKTKRLEIY
jgi:hypothetical protein